MQNEIQVFEKLSSQLKDTVSFLVNEIKSHTLKEKAENKAITLEDLISLYKYSKDRKVKEKLGDYLKELGVLKDGVINVTQDAKQMYQYSLQFAKTLI